MRSQYRPKRKALRRLCGVQAGTRYCLADLAFAIHALQRIRYLHCRQRALAAVDGVYRAVYQGGVDERTHGVMDQHHARRVLSQRQKSKARRLLPCRPSMDCNDPVAADARLANTEKLIVVRMNGDDDAAYPGMTEKRLERMRYDWSPADLTVLLRPVGGAGPLATARRDDDDSRLFQPCFRTMLHGETHSRAAIRKPEDLRRRRNFAVVPGCATG